MADKPIPRRLRFEVLRRDGHTCRYCGAQAPDVPLTVDHVIPRVLGGADDPTNLVTACRDCNAGKASTAPDQRHVDDVNQQVAEVDAAAMLFRRAMERAGIMRRAEMDGREVLISEWAEYWNHWAITHPDGREERCPLPTTWRDSIGRFLDLGLTEEDLSHFIDVTMARPPKVSLDERFRYFCGCCWRELTDRQELARRLIEDGAI